MLQAGDSSSALRELQASTRIDLLVTDVCLEGGNQRSDNWPMRQGLCVPNSRCCSSPAMPGRFSAENGFTEPGMEVMVKPFSLAALALRVGTLIKIAA